MSKCSPSHVLEQNEQVGGVGRILGGHASVLDN